MSVEGCLGVLARRMSLTRDVGNLWTSDSSTRIVSLIGITSFLDRPTALSTGGSFHKTVPLYPGSRVLGEGEQP